MPLLYVDLLGMKARYANGVASAQRGYKLPGELVVEALEARPDGCKVSGGVQSDAASLQFADARDAVIVGKALFRGALQRSASTGRVWIRGVIMATDECR